VRYYTSMSALRDALTRRMLVLDGAMGTMLQAAGLTAADFGGPQYEGCNEHLNLTRPDVVRWIHTAYLDAGADIVSTNTFGCAPYVLGEYGLAERAYEIAQNRKQEFPDILQYLIERAEGKDAEPMSLAAMVLSLSLASNHTTAMALTEALYDLCAHPEYQAVLRDEVQAAIDEDGGWKKTTILKMRKLDSFIKESQRMHPPSLSKLTVAFHVFRTLHSPPHQTNPPKLRC